MSETKQMSFLIVKQRLSEDVPLVDPAYLTLGRNMNVL